MRELVPFLLLLSACSSGTADAPPVAPIESTAPAPEATEPAQAATAEQPASLAQAQPSQQVGDTAMPTVDLTHPPGDMAAFGSASTELAARLYDELRQRDGNIVFSPASIAVALGMTYGGARGDTATEMGRALAVERLRDPHAAFGYAIASWNDPSRGVTLRVANRLFVDRSATLEAPYVALTRDRYGAAVETLDFAHAHESARAAINTWVDGFTAHHITDLLPAGSIDPLTRVVLTNAVYFRGTWHTQFDPRATQDRYFTTGTQQSIRVPMMQTKSRFAYAHVTSALGGHGLRLVALPYVDRSLEMVFILPDQVGDFSALEQGIGDIETWRGQSRTVEVDVRIPRFRLEPPSIALKDVLQHVGMGRAFAPDADFTGIARLADGLYISDVFHKAFIEINEEGTEAAAATAVVMQTRGMGPPPAPEPPRFYADRPFLFAIRDEHTHALLFLGRVSDPR